MKIINRVLRLITHNPKCFFYLIPLLFNNPFLHAQCTNASYYTHVTAPTNTTTCATITPSGTNLYILLYSATANTSYTSYSNAGDYITITLNATSPVIQSGNSPLTWSTKTETGPYYYMHVHANSSCDLVPTIRTFTICLNDPTPIQLISFSAKCKDNTTVIRWQTATEQNNHYFTLDRSIDGVIYKRVTIVPGVGNSSSTIDYLYTDHEPQTRITHYRLSQTDFNGQTKTFAPVATDCTDNNEPFSMQVNENPVTNGEINISINNTEDEHILFTIRDIIGHQIYSKMLVHDTGNYIVTLYPDVKMPSGIYLLTASGKNMFVNRKIIVQ